MDFIRDVSEAYKEMNLVEQLAKEGLVSEVTKNRQCVSTGCLALNRILSGKYDGGFPFGGMSQILGGSSTAKSAILLNTLGAAQKQGFITVLDDCENSHSEEFGNIFGIDDDELVYANSYYVEEAFDSAEKRIKSIREKDPDTPIVYGLDSLAVLQTQDEWEAGKGKEEKKKNRYEQSNTDGMVRARIMGACLRRLGPVLKENNVALIFINQVREKMTMYGDPEVAAAGGRALEFYLLTSIKTTSNKNFAKIGGSGDVLLDDGSKEDAAGIKGKIKCVKNKTTIPYQSCDFKLVFGEGMDPLYGVTKFLVKDGIIEKNSAWYNMPGTDLKWQGEKLDEYINLPEAEKLREVLGVS